MLIIKLLSGVSFLIILYLIVFKLRHQFWSRQPVFHYHNIFYWLRPPGQIERNNNKIEHPRYYDNKIQIKQTEDTVINEIVPFICDNFISEHDLTYSPTKENILSYLNEKSTICLKYINDKLIGCISGRSLNCYEKNSNQTFSLNYIDYLCVHKGYRKMGIAPRIIYTFYDYLKRNKEEVCLFKKEGVLSPYVPITAYFTYCVDIDNYIHNNIILTKNINYKILYDNIEFIKERFKLLIIPPINHIMQMKNIHILGICELNTIHCLFFFRKTFVNYKNEEVIELFASIKNISETQFISAFFGALSTFKNKYLFIENISDNSIILVYLHKHFNMEFKTKTGYYFYNYASSPFFSKDVLIIT